MKRIIFLALTTALAFASCKKDKVKNQDKVFDGPEKSFQHGKAWTWYETDNEGNPKSLAISIDAAAMNGLDRGGEPGHNHENDLELDFPYEAHATPFDHVGLDWNPHGHEPEIIYGRPHFDFHFYMMSKAEVDAIPPYEVDSTKFKNWPAPEYLPPTYFNAGGGVPMMGAHWVDLTSPEFNGQVFTQTFIYGSYDGKVTFYEPMITEDFLNENTTYVRDIPQPARYKTTGYYPTKMRYERKDGNVNIILEGFVLRQAS